MADEDEQNVDASGSKYSGYCSQESLNNLADDVGSLWHSPLKQIPVLEQPPSPLIFLRDFVSVSRPCIIRNCIPSHDNADQPLVLTLDNLVELCRSNKADMKLTCDVTPDGHGDCVRTVKTDGTSKRKKRFFVKPEERSMTIQQFRTELREGREEWSRRLERKKGDDTCIERDPDGLTICPISDCKSTSYEDDNTHISVHRPVIYYSRQNDCLRTELQPLFDLNLFPQTLAFAEEAFATGPPDAVNLWIGDERAVSSMHKDHYENLFYVLGGEKIFTLCPPADIPFLHEGEFGSGTFRYEQRGNDSGKWAVDPDYEDGEEGGSDAADCIQRVRWVEPDIENPGALDRYPLLQKAHPIRIKVSPGEMLYLPALWYHRVTQSKETVGLNYWYDMRFDSPSWCYFNLLQHMKIDDSVC